MISQAGSSENRVGRERGNLSVLIVEDDPNTRKLLELCLTQRGHDVAGAETGREAMRLLDARHFDIAAVDVLLPDGDGIDVINHVKGTKNPVRIVAVSGGGRYVDSIYCRDLALATGAHAALLKPFSNAEFVSAIEGSVRKSPGA